MTRSGVPVADATAILDGPVSSVTRRTSSGRARRGAVEALVLDAVERLLAGGEPYTSLGVLRIADEAGVARSSFYLHFQDKTDLIMRLATSATDDLFGIATAWLRGDGDQSRDGLRDVVRCVVRERRTHGPLLDALEEVAGYDATLSAFWSARMEELVSVIRDRMAHEREAGRLVGDADIPATAHLVAWGVERAISRPVIGARSPEAADEALVGAIARSIWLALSGTE